ncbi:unnamed protein product [Ectocarpus sp. 8 AP-2014]
MYSLEGDGVCEHLYEFISCKDELSFRPTINIADTIVYKFGQPVSWYFTGVDGKVKKKFKTNIINAKIEEAFVKASVGSDVVAYYISWTSNGSKYQDENEDKTTIEYLDRQGLRNFLFNRWKERNGILQRFVEPKGTRNAMVRAIWSPKMCLLERRVNCRQLHDRRYGIYERAVTYDGPDIFSTACPLRGSVLPSQVQRCCESVVAHVSEVLFRKTRVCRMSLNFKIDSRDRVWLLWSNSIRLASEMPPGRESFTCVGGPINIGELVKISSEVTLQQGAAHHREEIKSPAIGTCSSCGKTSSGSNFHAVHYKTIIAHFEQVVDLVSCDPANRTGVVEWPPSAEILEAAGGVGFGDISLATNADPSTIATEDVVVPPIIRSLHPKLAAEGYERHRRDPLFLYKTAFVCESCFLVYAELASLAFRATGRQALTDHTISTQFSAMHRSHTLSRLKLKEDSWQPLPKKKSRMTRPMGSSNVPQQVSPELPRTIRSREEDIIKNEAGRADSGSGVVENSGTRLDDIIRAREEDFFRELSAEEHTGTHPLMHMVASQQKLRSIGVPAHQVDPRAAIKKSRRAAKMSPYERPQTLVEYTGRSDASALQTKPAQLHTTSKKVSLGDPRAGSNSSSGYKISSSAAKHREFLDNTLSAVHEQLESTALADISGQGTPCAADDGQ